MGVISLKHLDKKQYVDGTACLLDNKLADQVIFRILEFCFNKVSEVVKELSAR